MQQTACDSELISRVRRTRWPAARRSLGSRACLFSSASRTCRAIRHGSYARARLVTRGQQRPANVGDERGQPTLVRAPCLFAALCARGPEPIYIARVDGHGQEPRLPVLVADVSDVSFALHRRFEPHGSEILLSRHSSPLDFVKPVPASRRDFHLRSLRRRDRYSRWYAQRRVSALAHTCCTTSRYRAGRERTASPV
ncbi:hypothetical protein EXIGLDRAFT_424562 [Exidia glandulosa HHB12029]|uniref:Uncharacterized protein n=1 Tax=Exidia glandulosa HHB12029 TaxID=1314781 RepID=A0A165KKK0_EXIGL|nr:hypothetical protein EXIGLDRAFT_424562 [Exidia glandulosa HHB12029]